MDKITTYKAVFDSAPDGVIIADQQGTILLVNNQAEKLFGYTKNELVDQKIELVIPKRFHSAHTGHRSGYASHPSAREMGATKELWASRKDGTEFAVEISLSPINLENKTLISAAIRDVTDKKKAESEIAAQNKKLQLQNKELEQFTYLASHDLQEPLRTLISFSALIKEEYTDKLDEEFNQYIDFIYQSSNRMQELVKGLMDYSRIGKVKELATIDCSKILDEVLSDLSMVIKEKNAQITISKLPEIQGYPTEIRLVLQNLISNSLKFTKTGSIPEIDINAKELNDNWHFSIQDNGIGIDEKNISKIFKIFRRLHNRNQYEGTGIGLSHCEKIIDLHGGKIWVESKLGEGSIFNFTIPKNITVQ
jgi:PAS domain S-box-containing protein